ncbi:hypothetical protein KFK09_029194 [Dendrobium nobile]|uniref:Uncharacterized protein n=1 Tax=Dendrobium nobile TaxID=94219 RepID=A0A8T3A5A0_DENNO|nr:hypothetical protein KFK09_029194 [Dendrobium nobile]
MTAVETRFGRWLVGKGDDVFLTAALYVNVKLWEESLKDNGAEKNRRRVERGRRQKLNGIGTSLRGDGVENLTVSVPSITVAVPDAAFLRVQVDSTSRGWREGANEKEGTGTATGEQETVCEFRKAVSVYCFSSPFRLYRAPLSVNPVHLSFSWVEIFRFTLHMLEILINPNAPSFVFLLRLLRALSLSLYLTCEISTVFFSLFAPESGWGRSGACLAGNRPRFQGGII